MSIGIINGAGCAHLYVCVRTHTTRCHDVYGCIAVEKFSHNSSSWAFFARTRRKLRTRTSPRNRAAAAYKAMAEHLCSLLKQMTLTCLFIQVSIFIIDDMYMCSVA